MTIRFNGGDNPTAIKFIQNGTTTAITKVNYNHNGVVTTVWYAFPETLSDITITLTNGATITVKSIRFDHLDRDTITGADIAAYTYTISARIPMTEWTVLGRVDSSSVTVDYSWSVRSVSGVPGGYKVHGLIYSPLAKQSFHITKKQSTLVRAMRDTQLIINTSTNQATMGIYYNQDDVVFAAASDIVYSGDPSYWYFWLERS